MRYEAAPAEAVRAGEHDRVVQHFKAYGALIILQKLLARRPGLLLQSRDSKAWSTDSANTKCKGPYPAHEH